MSHQSNTSNNATNLQTDRQGRRTDWHGGAPRFPDRESSRILVWEVRDDGVTETQEVLC
jgi:hypothetical protein